MPHAMRAFASSHPFLLRSFLPRGASFLLVPFIQQSEKTVEDDACLLQKFSIVAKILAQTIYDRVKSGGLETVKLLVFEIDVVHDLSQLA